MSNQVDAVRRVPARRTAVETPTNPTVQPASGSDGVVRYTVRALSASILISVGSSGFAADFRPNITILHDEVTYDLSADGRYTKDEVASYRINTDQGVKDRGQLPLPYSASLQDLEVREAYTTTKDGKRNDVAPDKIVVQQSPQSKAAPMFDDGKIKTVIFPSVEVGSTLTVHYRMTQRKPLFPNEFSIVEIASVDDEYKSAQITVRAPASLKLYADAVDMHGGPVAADKADEQLWRWSIDNVPAQAKEVGSVGAIDRSPRVVVTTFPSYQSAAAAYLQRARPQAAVTPAIQKLAEELTRGIAEKRAQAEALYRWVSSNIRYVAIFFSYGGVVPHSAAEILDAKYGDCKDHTVLLEALLAARGIKSSPVLVNATDSYWSTKAPAVPGVFNHAISYLPELDLFVDSTAGVAMFGVLPITEQGKTALVTDDGTGKAALVTLPLNGPETDQVSIVTKLTMDATGNIKGTSEVTGLGVFDWLARQIFTSLPPGAETQVASRVLTLTGQNGSGTYEHSGLRDLTKPLSFTTEFQLPGYAQLPGPGAMAVPQGLTSFSNIAAAFDIFGPETRTLPIVYAGRKVTEAVHISLPAGVKISALPRPTKLTSSFGHYESSYSAEEQTVTVRRNLEIRLSSPLVPPADYPALRNMALGVMRDLRSQLMY
jgi:transglutaminase-like putative cysteine protease